MRLIGSYSKLKFFVLGVITLGCVCAFGFLSLLGSLLAFDQLNRLIRGELLIHDFEPLYATGIGGVIGLAALLWCWLSIMWIDLVKKSPRILIGLLAIGGVSAIFNGIYFVLIAGSEAIPFLGAISLCVLLAATYIYELLTIAGSTRTVCAGP